MNENETHTGAVHPVDRLALVILFADTETYSETSIRVGMPRYAETAEVMLFAYAIDDGPVSVWDRTTGELMPDELENALRSAEQVVFHNAQFDVNVLRYSGVAHIEGERVHCTMAQALAHSLPGSLDLLSQIYNLGTDSKIDGKKLIRRFCQPLPKNSKLRRATRETHPQEWASFVEYAGKDIIATRALYKKLPTWNYRGKELDLWRLDQRIQQRGIAIDLDFCRAALGVVDSVQQELGEATAERTNGAVNRTTERDKLLAHLLKQYGVTLPDLKAGTLERRLEDQDLPAPVRELLAMRLEASQTSGRKHSAFLKAVNSDGRLRYTTQFCGASRTGRWSGRVVQLQNLPRGEKYVKKHYDQYVEAIKAGSLELIAERPLEVISGTVRAALIAPPGKKLCTADLRNIEGRMLAWLAGEEWKLQAFREFDAGTGPDLYCLTYSRSLNVPLDQVVGDGDMRQIGKVQELALGFQGAVSAFSSMAVLYGVTLPEEQVLKIVKAWRKANSNIASFWYALENAARQAIQNPGATIECRRLRLRYNGAWLGVKLPSGRALCYPRARIRPDGKLAYDGFNRYTRKWQECLTYGGSLTENVTQAASRDVMAEALPRCEAAGYLTVLTVHDEVICETPDTPEFTADGLAALMATSPDWADGLPLAAAGECMYRYRK